MKSTSIITRIFLTVICQLSLAAVLAQDINRELILVRPYEPSVSDAQKITTLPSLRDTFIIKPTFVYSIQSRRIDTRFDVSPITPARLQPLPQPKLYRGYIKLGAGTLPNVHGEVALNTVRNKEYSAGALFRLDRAGGNVKLENEEKVFAGYNDLSGKVFANKFYHSSILYGEIGASGQTAYNYGYDTKSSAPIDTTFARGDITKRYFFTDANIGLRSSQFKTDQLNFDVKLGYKSAHNKLDDMYIHPNHIPEPDSKGYVRYNENAVNFKAQLDNNMFGGNLNFDMFNRSHPFDSLRNNFAIDFNPWFMLDNDSVRMQVGMRLAAYREGDGNMQYKIYPKIEFQFTLLKDIFIPFVGIDGYLSPNTYRNIITENPFVTPGLTVPITNTKLQIYAGLKGTITNKLSYYFRGDFSTSENAYFFVNDTSYSRAQNYFNVVTGDLNIVSLKGELYFNPVESIDFGLKATHFTYQPSNQSRAWHRPQYTLEFLAKYNLRNKIIVNFDVMNIGKRYAKLFDFSPAPIPDPDADPDPDLEPKVDFYTLNSVIAFNLGIEYRYTRSFSLFLKLNNISGAKYERWNFFPSHRFNLMGGFTYSL